MGKTDRQMMLEMRHGKPVRELILEALDKHRGNRFYITLAALELEITPGTLRKWAKRFGVGLNEYGPPEDDQMEPGLVPAGAGKP